MLLIRGNLLRIGILGGTFDPIHFAHLRISEEIGEGLDLEKVYLIPAALPPHKGGKPVTSFDHRMAMIRLATEDSSLLEALDLEGRRKGISYSIETLRELHTLFKPDPELFFILGMDAFLEIRTWKEYKRLFDYAHIVVIQRPGSQADSLESLLISMGMEYEDDGRENIFILPSGNRLIYYKKTTIMGISSTHVRGMVARGETIRYLVPEPVRAYIMEKGLYRIHENT